jgi:hypothetical protein
MAAFLAWGCDSGRSAVSASPEGVEARPALQSQQVSREPAPPATVTAVASQLGNCSIAGVVQVKLAALPRIALSLYILCAHLGRSQVVQNTLRRFTRDTRGVRAQH